MSLEDQDFVLLNEDDVQDYNSKGVLPLADIELAKIQRWLAHTDYSATSSEWGKHHTSRLPGTGTWILNNDLYQQWHDSDRGSLWIKAVAGAGKSVIAATIVSRLAAEEKAPVLYFFFRHIVSANQKPKSLVCDFLSQALQYSPTLQNDLFKLINDDRRSLDSVSTNELWDILVLTLIQLPRTYCIVDALDEMDAKHEQFLEKLIKLAQMLPSSIKVLMTSRPIPRIEKHFRNTDVLQLLLQPQLVNPDISLYVKYRISTYSISPKMRSQIHDTMFKKADGHFLYARLMMDELLSIAKSSNCDEKRLLQALEELPTPMADMYTRMLLDHSQRSQTPQNLQLAILQWVTRAERPLRLLELSSLINIRMFRHPLHNDAKSVVREACGPLLEIFEDETVHPIHHSFTEYLYNGNRIGIDLDALNFPVLNYEEAHRALAITCLEHLTSGWHVEWLHMLSTSGNGAGSGSDWIKHRMKLKHPYLEYVTEYWDCHVRKSQADDNQITMALRKALAEDRHILLQCLKWEVVKDRVPEYQRNFESWTSLHAAAHKGITCFVELLIREGHNIEQLTSTDQTPLSLAARNGYHEVVRVLIGHGAERDRPDNLGLKPLHHAARANHWEVAKLLLETGVDPYTGKTKETLNRHRCRFSATIGDSPVMYACSFGHTATMKVFVPFLRGDGIKEALWWALTFNRPEIATEILQRLDVSVNHHFNHQTPLYLASRMRNLKLMRLLLDKGAKANVLSSEFQRSRGHPLADCITRQATPLHAFAESMNGHDISQFEDTTTTILEGLSTLIDAGVDPNAVDASGSTILHIIMKVRKRHNRSEQSQELYIRPVLKFLLDRGLSPRLLSKNGSNALHLAPGVGLDVVDLLLEHKVDINLARKDDGKTPLITAIGMSDMALARHLLRNGADAKIAACDGNTALHVVASNITQNLDIDLVKELLLAGAAVGSRNHDGNTALHVGRFNSELANLLVHHGFDLETKNKLGQTLVFHSAQHGTINDYHEQLVQLGPDLSTRDNKGRTILHALLSNSQMSRIKASCMLRYFVEKGVDPKSVDVQGNNLWHVITCVRHRSHPPELLAVMDALMEYKVPPTARNLAGQTPLHLVFSVTPVPKSNDCLQFLLDHTRVDLNDPDFDQVRPLHLAVSYSIKLTCWLLEQGADAAVTTIEGQTPLMVACRTRQSDIVGVLLEHYKEKNLQHLINKTDKSGQTALHHACRSGKPESVIMLLEAGANVHLKDRTNATPLHACAEYLLEDVAWQKASKLNKTTKASFVLSTDTSRPVTNKHLTDPVRVRETIRLLVNHGADATIVIEDKDESLPKRQGAASISSRSSHVGNPFAVAVEKGCSPMISELLLVHEKQLQESEIRNSEFITRRQISNEPLSPNKEVKSLQIKRIRNFRGRVDLLKVQYEPNVVADLVQPGKNNFQLAHEILVNDGEPGLKQMAELGAAFQLLEDSGESIPTKLASWGFASLLYELREHAAHMTAAWAQEMVTKHGKLRAYGPWSLLYTALTRCFPNMAVVKVVVEKFQHDVNEMFRMGAETHLRTYTHVLARPSHWWQTKALIYLLANGALVDCLTSDGETPLIVALKEVHTNSYDPARIKAVEILLEHGANPNATALNGLSCLNLAAQQPKCVAMLLKHGADPVGGVRPFLLDAVEAQDIDMIQRLIALGADVNRMAHPVTIGFKSDPYATIYARGEVEGWSTSSSLRDLTSHAYPIHVAASKFFNLPEKLDQARKIIDLLLKQGANPFLMYDDGSTILHCLARNGGILEPFLSLPACDLEVRDLSGRTLLLAACDAERMLYVGGQWNLVKDDNIKALISGGASIFAIDNEGRNALHHLINHFPPNEALFGETQAILQPFLSILLLRADCQGRTPYHYALQKPDIALVELLLTHGSDPTFPNPFDNTTALHHLAPLLMNFELFFKEFHESNPVKFMPAMRPQTFSPSDKFMKIPELASKMSSERLTKVNKYSPRRLFTDLINRGLSVNQQDADGETPLLNLADRGGAYGNWIFDKESEIDDGLLLNVLHDLNKVGVNFKARNNLGESVLHKLARHSGSTQNCERRYRGSVGIDRDLSESVKYLVGMGADITWEDNEQRTCLDVAAASGARWLLKLYERE